MSSSPSPTSNSSNSPDSLSKNYSPNYIITDIAIGSSILIVAIIIYTARLLYKRRKKYFKDNGEISMADMELPPPKKTAADHLEEIKEATQKIFVPLKLNSSKSSFENSNILPTLKERPSLNSTRSSNSSDKKVERKERTFDPSKSSMSKDSSIHNPKHSSRYSSRADSGPGSGENSTRLGSLPPPPPPSPLDFQDDDSIENEPIPMQLVDILLSKTFPESPSESSSRKSLINSRTRSPKSKVPSQISVDSEQSFPRSSISSHRDSSRLLSPSPRDRLSPKRPDRNSVNSVHFILDEKVHNRYKETNDYTNFQPIQNIQNFNKVKTVIEEDDDEVIL